MATMRVTVISSIANRGPSRPIPESLTPPYGAMSDRKPGTSLMTMPPASIRSIAAYAVASDEVKMLQCSPIASC